MTRKHKHPAVLGDDLVRYAQRARVVVPEIQPKNAEEQTADFLNDLQDRTGAEVTDDELHQLWDGKAHKTIEDAFAKVERHSWKKAKQATVTAGAAALSGGRAPTIHEDTAETDAELVRQYEKASKQPTRMATELRKLTELAHRRGLLRRG